MKRHPTRQADDDHLFDRGYNGYNPLTDLWLAFVPKWVDTALAWLVGLAVVAGLILGIKANS